MNWIKIATEIACYLIITIFAIAFLYGIIGITERGDH